MFGIFRKRTYRKQILDMKTLEEEKEELQDVAPPPSYIRISDGKVSLVHQPLSCETNTKDKSQCGSPTFERDLREQLENMNRAMKSKDRKTVQACRDNKALQARFARQETLLHNMQQENKALTLRIRQYEHCLDDVMRKVVDAIVLEDSLRQEVSVLKSRVYELEAQNAVLSGSPAKGKDEGYCTMSSGQPQPSNGHLEDLPEEPEQWLLPAEPCSTEMEDWSMSQEELGVITLEDEVIEHEREHERDWIWNTSDFLNSTMMASQSEGIAKLLQQTIVFSEDEEVACVDFTKDFYKLVNIPSGSTRSLYSYLDAETDDEDDTTSENCRTRGPSPTPSEAGQAQVTSCSSSESDEHTRCIAELPELVSSCSYEEPQCILRNIQNDEVKTSKSEATTPTNLPTLTSSTATPAASLVAVTTKTTTTTVTAGLKSGPSWRRSNGWKRLPSLESPTKKENKSEKSSPTSSSSSPSTPPISRIPTCKQSSPIRKSKIPPPVPVRRSYAS
ncbi:uncharacterized protein LOC129921028 isoform X3 [Episyrphus balteatus]|uniref:uncharacterized protein LOC129921028 isoform X3 n=1 Tax=Episyrphus balteatus TaxID=286459 RepID=UPI00248598B2|nr:uncharacterized protein LOC129921028 isoform X3 [Episyrphus balteatus]